MRWPGTRRARDLESLDPAIAFITLFCVALRCWHLIPSIPPSAAMSPSSTPHHHRPSASSATSSPSSPCTSSSPLPPWHFPFGPSSRFHEREKTRPQHSRYKSAYTPTAPVLSTAARAHRRAHTNNKKSISSLSSASSSSATSDTARSPLSRFASTNSAAAMPNYRYVNVVDQPRTPAKTSRRGSSLQNSPFSDYFTDDARSVDTNLQSTETKQLLLRMNKLQSQLMRDKSEKGSEAIKVVGASMDKLERDLAAMYSQSRAPFEAEESVEDSAVFMDEDGSESKITSSNGDIAPITNGHAVSEPYLNGLNMNGDSVEDPPEPVTVEQYKAERDWFVLNMQDTLERLRNAHTELGHRYNEVREINEYNSAQIEEHETQLEQLRSENEGLRSDLGFEYSELLFLKLQMKSIEVDVDTMSVETGVSGAAAIGERRSKKNRILSEMDRWRSDWQDVYGRFKRRRSKYGVSPDRRDSVSSAGSKDVPGSGEGVEWHLETVKEGRGRVTSLTIRRMDSSCESSPVEAKPEDSEQPKALEDSTATLDATPLSTSSPSSSQQDLEGYSQTTQGSREPQIASSHQHSYAEQGTQTESLQTPLSQDEEEAADAITEAEEDITPTAEEDTLFPYNNNTIDDSTQSSTTSPTEDEAEAESGHEDAEDSDCAITTSSEADDAESDYEDVEEVSEDEGSALGASITTLKPPAKAKTAWQELWTSLSNLSGMGEMDEEEED